MFEHGSDILAKITLRDKSKVGEQLGEIEEDKRRRSGR